MFAPALVIALLTSAPDVPAPPAPPAPPCPAAAVTAPAPPAPPAAAVPPWGAPPPDDAELDGPAGPGEWVIEGMPAAAAALREVRTDTLFAARPGMALEVHNLAGRIAVAAWRRNLVHIVAEHARRDRVDAHLVHGALVVHVVNPRGEAAFGDVTVNVPEWMPLRLTSMDSPIQVAGVRAPVDAGSVRGDVVVRGVRGPLQLRSVEGGVEVVDARGWMHVASINSVVRLERVEGPIDAESVNGDIEMAQVESPGVDASSVNGSVLFDGPFQPRGRYRLVSHNGNLRVGVPVGADVDVSVSAFEGAFRSGIPVPVGPHRRGRTFTFTLGDGGASLQLESFQGLIQLLRSEGLAAPPRVPPPGAPQEDR